MRVNRDSAAIVADRQPVLLLQPHLDEACVTGDGLVHRIVEDLGCEVVQRRLVRSADIHARPPADGLQPLQNLDVPGGVALRLPPGLLAARGTEQIVHAVFLSDGCTLQAGPRRNQAKRRLRQIVHSAKLYIGCGWANVSRGASDLAGSGQHSKARWTRNAPCRCVGPTALSDPAAPPNWQRTLWAMVGIQFVMTLSFTILSPILPLFLPELGVSQPSRIDLWAGILNGTTSFVAAFASPLWGRLSDRKGRKLMLLRSSFAIGLFTALMGVSITVWQFFAMRALMGAFAGFSAAAIALVASQVPEGRLGYALGWLSTGQLVGGLVGPGRRRYRFRPVRQLSRAVLCHGRHHIHCDGARVVLRRRAVYAAQARPKPALDGREVCSC